MLSQTGSTRLTSTHHPVGSSGCLSSKAACLTCYAQKRAQSCAGHLDKCPRAARQRYVSSERDSAFPRTARPAQGGLRLEKRERSRKADLPLPLGGSQLLSSVAELRAESS